MKSGRFQNTPYDRLVHATFKNHIPEEGSGMFMSDLRRFNRNNLDYLEEELDKKRRITEARI